MYLSAIWENYEIISICFLDGLYIFEWKIDFFYGYRLLLFGKNTHDPQDSFVVKQIQSWRDLRNCPNVKIYHRIF